MGALDIYFAKHEKVIEGLAAAAEGIPEDKTMWKPCEKALPWIRLIDHTSVLRRHLVLKALKEEPLDMAFLKDASNFASTPSQAAQAQRDSWEELKGFLLSQPEGFVKKEVAFTKGRMMTVEQLIWFAYEENVHHRGQAWIYARINGLTPPAIWGTEQPD